MMGDYHVRFCEGLGGKCPWSTRHKEHLLVSKALPIFWAPHYFCACSDLSLLYEAYNFSSQADF